MLRTGPYRGRIENRIRAGNGALSWLHGVTRKRIRRNRLVTLAAAVAAAAVFLGQQSPESSSWTAPPHIPVLRAEPRSETGLDPDLTRAVRRAQEDASAAGIEIQIRSGRRSPEEQARLLREAIAKYGSHEQAARWVATPETSPHVSGDAVDIGPPAAAAWLAQHGPAYGLCRIYANEPWHFELRPRGCPPLYPDPTYDPRMR